MWNPFKAPLNVGVPAMASADNYGYPGTQNVPDQPTDGEWEQPGNGTVVQNPVAIGDQSGDLQQETNPAYAGTFTPKHNNMPGIVPTFQEINSDGYSRSLNGSRTAGETASTNTFYMPDGPVSGVGISSAWSGVNTSLRAPVVGQQGPVSGGRSSGEQASLSYFASVAQQASQDAINRNLVMNV